MNEPYPEALLESIRKAVEKVAPEGATDVTVTNSVLGTETIDIEQKK